MAFDRRSIKTQFPELLRVVGRCGATVPVCGALALAAAGVHAQTNESEKSTARSGLTIVPTFSASEIWTDNRDLSATRKEHDWITQLSPGLRLTSRIGRVTGFLDYSMSGLVYANASSKNDIQHALNSNLKADVVENWAFVDFAGSISQQAVSALGTQSSDTRVGSTNSAQVTNLSVSPYLRGELAGVATYEARLTRTVLSGGASAASNSATQQSSLNLSGARSGPLNWSALGSREVVDFSAGRQTEVDRLKTVLSYKFDPQFKAQVSAGRESSNVESAEKQKFTTSGFGANWRPSDRTSLSFERERRLFGNSHSFNFEHRTPRTVWRYSDVRDVSSSFGISPVTSPGTWFDLFYNQLASSQPDAALRERDVYDKLGQLGLNPSARAVVGTLTSALTVQRRQELSFALIGIRDTVTFTATQSEGQRADAVTTVRDDFSDGNLIRQRGFLAGLAHRLTPDSSLNLLASQQRTTGTAGGQSTSLRSLSATWANQFGKRTRVSLGARRSNFDSPTEPYSETAVLADLRLQF